MNTLIDLSIALQQLVMQADDERVKQMLVECSVTMPATCEPPNDYATVIVQWRGHRWLVFKHYDPTDPGYLAYGLPEETPREEWEGVFAFIIETVLQDTYDRGGDPLAHAQYIDLKRSSN